MPVGRKGRKERVSEEDALQRWFSLTLDERQAILRFEDPALVECIHSCLQLLFEKQAFLNGILALQDHEDPFENSMLFKEAFEFTWSISRCKQDPDVVLVDTKQYPAMVMKDTFLQRTDFVECIRRILPDFLTPQSPRTTMPRARWKDLWTTEPASVAAFEQQLAKLIEQALWAMAQDPMYKTKLHTSDDAVDKFEPWMEEYDKKTAKLRESQKKKKKKQKSRSTPARHLPEESGTTVEEEEEEEDEEEEPTPNAARARGRVDSDNIFTPENGVESTAHERLEKPSESLIVSGRYLSMPLPEKDMVDIEEEPYVFGESSYGEEHCRSSERRYHQFDTSPSSPSKQHSDWQPQDLVRYIWGQTAQFAAQGPGVGTSCTTPMLCTGSTRTPSSLCLGTAPSRGRWITPNLQTPVVGNKLLRVVVRNTFLEVDECNLCPPTPPQRASRSLSPTNLRISSYSPQNEDIDPWFWYWH